MLEGAAELSSRTSALQHCPQEERESKGGERRAMQTSVQRERWGERREVGREKRGERRGGRERQKDEQRCRRREREQERERDGDNCMTTIKKVKGWLAKKITSANRAHRGEVGVGEATILCVSACVWMCVCGCVCVDVCVRMCVCVWMCVCALCAG